MNAENKSNGRIQIFVVALIQESDPNSPHYGLTPKYTAHQDLAAAETMFDRFVATVINPVYYNQAKLYELNFDPGKMIDNGAINHLLCELMNNPDRLIKVYGKLVKWHGKLETQELVYPESEL